MNSDTAPQEPIDESADEESVEFSQVAPPGSSQKAIQSQTLLNLISVEQRKDWPVTVVAAATFVTGLFGAVQPLFTRLAHSKIASALVPYEYYDWSKSFTVFFGLFLIYVSINLLKKKRMAWLLGIVGNTLSFLILIARIHSERVSRIASQFVDTSLPLYALIPPIATLALLIAFRNKFSVLSEKSTIKLAVVVIAALGITMLAYGTLGFWLLDKRDFGINFQLSDSLMRTVRLMTFQGNSDLVAHTRHATWFLDSLQLYGFVAFTFAGISLFRPLHYRWNTQPRERQQAQAILNKFGRTSLDSYKLLADKSYFFSTDRNGFIAYRGAFGVALGLSDPTGEFEKLPALVEEFRQMCHKNDWLCGFLQTTPETVPLFEELKFEVLKIGEDAIVDLENFATKVVKKKTFKSPMKKLEKEGFTVEKLAPPHSAELINSLKQVSDEWLSLPGRRERGFSLGAFDVEELNKTPVFCVKNSQGSIIAFVNQVRSYREGEVTVDLMRHRAEHPNGVMDFLFGKTLLMLKEEGFKYFSLGLAALSGVGNDKGACLEEKAIKQIYENMNRFFSYKGLRAYKDKFDPVWEDRFLVYEGGPAGLLRTTVALARVTEGSDEDDD